MPCAEPACEKPHAARGFCNTHYMRWWRAEQPRPRRVSKQACEATDCEKPHLARGFCDTHYRAWWRAQNPEGRITHSMFAAGVSTDDCARQVVAQGGVCAICGRIRKETLCLDHDHVTGRPRGMLCIRCNSALAALGDTPEGLRKALAYLERPPWNNSKL